MSERDPETERSADNESIRAKVGRPGPVHEALYNKIMADVEAMVKEYAPTFGTVKDNDGGRPVVSIDDEDDSDRTVGFTKKRGQRYEKGDRVKVQKTRSGEYIADGSFSDKGGRDPVVGEDDLLADSVDKTQLKQNSVTDTALAGDSVSRNALKSEVTNFITAQGDIGREAKQAAQDAQQTANSKADKDHTHNYAEKNHDHNYASNNHSHNYADKNHNHSQNDISGLVSDIRNIKDRLDRLEKKGN